MLKNYLKMAFKVLVRRKFFTAVSLFGIGFTLLVLLVVAALLDNLLAPVTPEVNLDRSLHFTHIEAEGGPEDRHWAIYTFPGYRFLDQYLRDLPNVEKMSIHSNPFNAVAFIDGRKEEFQMKRTDGPFWEILDFRFLEGGPFTAEDEANAEFVAVISEDARRRLFGGDGPALGRTFEVDGQRFRVAGVVENVAITRLSAYAQIWVPHSTAKSQDFRNDWFGSQNALLLARSRSDIPGIQNEFRSRLAHMELDFERPVDEVRGLPMTRLEEVVTHLENLSDGEPPVARVALMILGVVAAFLLLPTINLMSINLSRIFERSSEIGVRKAFGASSAHLVGQFIVENVVLCLLGGVLALAGAAVALEILEAYGVIPFARFSLNYRVFFYALGLACIFGVLSGAYPAWRTSRLHPVEALRGGAR